jgi:hypothetical protein
MADVVVVASTLKAHAMVASVAAASMVVVDVVVSLNRDTRGLRVALHHCVEASGLVLYGLHHWRKQVAITPAPPPSTFAL